MKNIITFLLLASPFIINAQEPVKENKGNKTTPPSSEKSISEKGVSSTKGRGIKKPTDTQMKKDNSTDKKTLKEQPATATETKQP